jgi:hypothetical protein
LVIIQKLSVKALQQKPHESQALLCKAILMVHRFGLFNHDPTEVAIQKMIDASQRMLGVQSQVGGEPREEGWGINPL